MNTPLRALALALLASAAHAQTSDSLRIYYVGRPVGWERYDVGTRGDSTSFVADFSYVDRGRRIHLASTMVAHADYSPKSLDVYRVTDTSRTLQTHVDMDGRAAILMAGRGQSLEVKLPRAAFALSAYQPLSQHLALLRYWRAHGRPDTIDVVPGAPTNKVAIRDRGRDTVTLDGRAVVLTRYTIDGVIWGREYAWLGADDHLAMFAAAGGGLSIKAIRASLVPVAPKLMDVAARVAIADLVAMTSSAKPASTGPVALVGATLIDATGRPATPNAVVIVRNGKIEAAGPAETTPIPDGIRRIDESGKTIVPGLWDMHAHLHQLEWVPVYLAAGVTTVRDMGNELPFITRLRAAVSVPRIVAAGLIDGDGPNAFGEMSASTPEEGRAIVRRYHDLGFEQMKLYSLLSPAVVGAVCDEAHKLGMTVTGHIPTSLTLLAAVDSGMDQIAHLSVRGEPGSEDLRRTIDHLRAKGTVIDPTVSWNEIGGHSTAEPLESFQPVTKHLPSTFLQFRAAGWGSATVDTATAHSRLARSLAIIGELHRAGVPIVPGTDEGVPGFSVYRELELYVRAGMSPMDAVRSATAVSAKAMRLDREVGTLEPGKRADLLVLDANPLDDISNIRRVRSVMAGGVFYDSAKLWRIAGFTP